MCGLKKIYISKIDSPKNTTYETLRMKDIPSKEHDVFFPFFCREIKEQKVSNRLYHKIATYTKRVTYFPI